MYRVWFETYNVREGYEGQFMLSYTGIAIYL